MSKKKFTTLTHQETDLVCLSYGLFALDELYMILTNLYKLKPSTTYLFGFVLSWPPVAVRNGLKTR